jgi:surface protein
MTIASELTTLNATKQALKTAIEAKGQSLTGVAFSGYPAKVSAISGGTSSAVWSQANYDSVLAAVPAWARDPSWLALPTLSTKGLVGLMAVGDTTDEVAALLGIGGAYTVDWGDGVVENFASGVSAYHIYTFSSLNSNTTLANGFRQAIVQVYPQSGQSFTSIDLSVRHTRHTSAVYESGWLDINLSTDASTTRPLLTTNANAIEALRMDQLERFVWASSGYTGTDLSYMFYNLRNLASISLPSTSTVYNMSGMFQNCYSLQTIPLLSTASVNNMTAMFQNCYSLQTIPLLNTVTVTNTSYMFFGCYSLKTIPLLNTASVSNMNYMFYNCYSLQTIPLLSTAVVISMSSMFSGCASLQTIPLLNTAAVTSMSNMLAGCASLQTIPLLSTAAVTSMGSIFSGCTSLQTIPLLSTAAVTSMSYMFYNCYSLQTIPLLSTAAVANMGAMFQNCYSLQTIPLLNTAAVTNMGAMFTSCTSLQTIPLLNTAAVTNMYGMFQNCYSLQTIPLLNTIAVPSMSNVFNSCYALQTIPLLNTAAVTDMSSMFNTCYSLQTIPLLNTAAVTSTGYMLSSCPSLSRIQATGFKTTFSVSACLLSATAISELCADLRLGTSQTLDITGNFGASPLVSLSGTTAVGSTSITMSNTSGITVGMQVSGTGTPTTTGIACTFTASGSLVNKTAHRLSNGTEVAFSTITTTTGISINTIYYVVNATTDNFQVSATSGGSVLTLTNDGSGTLKYGAVVTAISANVSVTMSTPMVSSATNTLAFREALTYRALLRGWTVTG